MHDLTRSRVLRRGVAAVVGFAALARELVMSGVASAYIPCEIYYCSLKYTYCGPGGVIYGHWECYDPHTLEFCFSFEAEV